MHDLVFPIDFFHLILNVFLINFKKYLPLFLQILFGCILSSPYWITITHM